MTTEETPIAELFARDPLSLSDQDIDAIIDRLRTQRKRFVLGDKTAGNPKGLKKTAKEEAASKIVGDIDLGELGL